MVNCGLKDKNFNGNCEGCNNRTSCMMSEILDKLQLLENTVAQLKTKVTA